MNIAPLGEVKAKFSAYVKKAQDGPIIVTKNGKPVILMLQIKDDDDLERLLLANSPKFQALLDGAEKRIQESGGISHDDVWNEVGAEIS
jgi:prevent-host-death family protein